MNRTTRNSYAPYKDYPLQQDIYSMNMPYQPYPQDPYQDPYRRNFTSHYPIQQNSYIPRQVQQIYEDNIDKIAFQRSIEQPRIMEQSSPQYQTYNFYPIQVQQNMRRAYGNQRRALRTEESQKYLQPRQYDQYNEYNYPGNKHIFEQNMYKPEYYQDIVRSDYQNPPVYHNFYRQPLPSYEQDLQYYAQENQNINIKRRQPSYDQQIYLTSKKIPPLKLPKENLLIEKRKNNMKIIKNQNIRPPYNGMIHYPYDHRDQKLHLSRTNRTNEDYYLKYQQYYEKPHLSRSNTVQNIQPQKRLCRTQRNHLYGPRQSNHPKDYNKLLEIQRLRNCKTGYPYENLSKRRHQYYR